MRTLIVGGSSGLGLAMAKRFSDAGDQVIVTGRTDPAVDFADFQSFDLTQPDLASKIDTFVASLPEIDRLVYAAGLYLKGNLTDLSAQQIDDVLSISARGIIFFTRSILAKQESLDGLITISSMSQWTPSGATPVYNFVKAGMGHFSNSMANDGRIKKVLVVAPSTMADDESNEKIATKKWVANEITQVWNEDFGYKCVRIPNNPARIEEVEKR